MHAILLFALHRRFTGYIRNVDSIISLVLRVFCIALLLINAASVGWLIDVFTTSETNPIESAKLIQIVSAIFCGLWAFLEFFPAYTTRSNLVAGIFPIRFSKRWVANLVYDTITATTIGILFSFCVIDAVSTVYTHADLAISLLFLGNTIALIQVVKAFVESAHRNQFIFLLFWIILSGITGFLLWRWQLHLVLKLSILVSTLLSQFILLFLLDRATIEKTKISTLETVSIIKKIPAVYVASITNSKSRNAFLLGLTFKAFFLLFATKSFAKDMPMADFMLMLYISPVILFTYVANNNWGYFPALWINSTLGKRSDTIRTYFQLIILPLTIDIIITTSILLYVGLLSYKLSLFYVLVTVLLSVNGLIFSLRKAFYVHSSINFFQMKNNVNGWSIFADFLLIGITVLAFKTVLTMVLLSVSLLAGSWYVANQILKNETGNIHTLYKQLFTDRE